MQAVELYLQTIKVNTTNFTLNMPYIFYIQYLWFGVWRKQKQKFLFFYKIPFYYQVLL